MGWLAKLMGREPSAAAQIAAASTDVFVNKADAIVPAAVPRDPPGKRVYHEYFMSDGPLPDGLWHWHARVYASNGEVIENRGAHPLEQDAHGAAQAWSAMKKAELRGAP